MVKALAHGLGSCVKGTRHTWTRSRVRGTRPWINCRLTHVNLPTICISAGQPLILPSLTQGYRNSSQPWRTRRPMPHRTIKTARSTSLSCALLPINRPSSSSSGSFVLWASHKHRAATAKQSRLYPANILNSVNSPQAVRAHGLGSRVRGTRRTQIKPARDTPRFLCLLPEHTVAARTSPKVDEGDV